MKKWFCGWVMLIGANVAITLPISTVRPSIKTGCDRIEKIHDCILYILEYNFTNVLYATRNDNIMLGNDSIVQISTDNATPSFLIVVIIPSVKYLSLSRCISAG